MNEFFFFVFEKLSSYDLRVVFKWSFNKSNALYTCLMVFGLKSIKLLNICFF